MPLSRLYISILAALVAVIYLPTVGYDFVNIDDHGLIYANPIVVNDRVPYLECFRKFLFTPYFKPLVLLSWKWEYQLLGKGAWHFHLINALLHLVNSILVFKVGKYLFQQMSSEGKKVERLAFLWALLFAVHPFRIESVAWATERKDVLFAFFFLLSWLSYIRFLQSRQYRWMLLGAVLYLFGGLSKSMAITLPAVLLLTDFWLRHPFNLRSLLDKFPYGVSFILLILLFGFIKPFPIADSFDRGDAAPLGQFRLAAPNEQISTIPYIKEQPLPVQQVVTTSMRVFLWAVRNFIPHPLSINYPNNKYYGLLGRGIFLTPFILLLVFIISMIKRRSHPEYFFTFSFFLLTLSPVLIITTSGQAIFLSDRYLYIPSLALFFLTLIVLAKWQLIKARTTFIAAVIASGYFLYSLFQVGVWKNSGTLFRQALKVHPGSGMALLNLGLYYTEQKDTDKAFKVYSEAIARNTSYVQVYHNRARILLERGAVDSALTDLNKCLSIDSRLPYALSTRAEAYYRKGRGDSALIDLDRAIALDSSMYQAFALRARIFYDNNKYQEAIFNARNSLSVRASNAVMLNLIALSFHHLGRSDSALKVIDSAIFLNSGQGGYYFNRYQLRPKVADSSLLIKDLTLARTLGYVADTFYLPPIYR